MRNLVPILGLMTVVLGSAVARTEPVIGPGATQLRVEAGSSRWLKETYLGGKPAAVTVVGEAEASMEIIVYDLAGRLVARSTKQVDRRTCQFMPPRTQAYHIEIRNLGTASHTVAVMTH